MNYGSQFLWVIYPYLTIAVFFVGHIYRYNSDQLGWTAKSSEFFEKKWLRWGSMMFHIGILMVLVGHVVGLLIPKSVLESIGISETSYHMGAVYGGGFAGILTFVGILILMLRRLGDKRVRMTSSIGDIMVVILLFLIVGMGLYNTLIFNLTVGGFDYRETIAPWLRGLLMFRPNASLMETVPVMFQLHVVAAFTIFGLWPFTRLVHVWSVPISYLKRNYIVYRSRSVRR